MDLKIGAFDRCAVNRGGIFIDEQLASGGAKLAVEGPRRRAKACNFCGWCEYEHREKRP